MKVAEVGVKGTKVLHDVKECMQLVLRYRLCILMTLRQIYILFILNSLLEACTFSFHDPYFSSLFITEFFFASCSSFI